MKEETLAQIKRESLEEHIPIIMDDTLAVIQKILKEEKPARILEIGTATGYSSICFARCCENTVEIDTIERDGERAEVAKQNIEKMGLQEQIHILVGDALEILPTLTEESYDIIFIDAAKGKYPFFLEQSIRLAKKKAVILADNILYKGYVLGDYHKHKQRTAVNHLREYIKESTENPNLQTKILDVGDGLAISQLQKE